MTDLDALATQWAQREALALLPMADDGEHTLFDHFCVLFDCDLACLYWVQKTGERGMCITPLGLALREHLTPAR